MRKPTRLERLAEFLLDEGLSKEEAAEVVKAVPEEWILEWTNNVVFEVPHEYLDPVGSTKMEARYRDILLDSLDD